MPAEIPIANRYYPSVPVVELSDMYSKGDNRINGNRALIISYLSKVLRVKREEPFNNKYFLFIENTPAVDSIAWEYKLYLNNQEIPNPSYIESLGPFNKTEFEINFIDDMMNNINIIVYDKLIVKCTVRLGAETAVMSIEHSFIQGLHSQLGLNNIPTDPRMPDTGDPLLTNMVVNHFKDYITPFRTIQNNVIQESLRWNNTIIEDNVSNLPILLKIVTSIFYHFEPNNTQLPEDFYFNFNDFTNIRIRSLINSNVSYDGDFKNGICHIPLHILNDILVNFNQTPDFTTVDAGAGNPIYNIIRDNGLMTFNDLDGVLRTVPQQIKDSKLRLTNDVPRMVELYNLTLFPKSAIKLAAILIKYLFACSQKNNCNECLYKTNTWAGLPFSQLGTTRGFLNNILTHYTNGPINKIEKFSRRAKAINKLVWSPAIHLIITLRPRITRVYFAKKITTVANEDVNGILTPVRTFLFDRIDDSVVRLDQNSLPLANQPVYDSILGGKVYLVIETLQSRNYQVIANVMTNDNNITGNSGDILMLLNGRNDISTNIADYTSDLERIVGSYDDLMNNTNQRLNDKESEYYNIDHQDKVIIKLRLRTTVAIFNNWANNLADNTGTLKVSVQIRNQAFVYFGNHISSVNRNSVEFLGANDPYQLANFRLVNRIAFEIYKENGNGSWNFLPVVAGNRLRIGKINNSYTLNIPDGSPQLFARKASFYYYDNLDLEHFFGEFAIERPAWLATANYPNSPYLDGLSSLVNANEFIAYNSNGVTLSLLINTVDRRYIDISCFAATLGALAVQNIVNLGFNGFSNNLGQSVGGSVSHVNGIRGDFRYLRTNLSGAQCLLSDAQFDNVRQTSFNNSLHDFGWARTENMLSETFGANLLLPHCVHFHIIRIGGISHNSRDVVPNQDLPQFILNGPLAGTQQNAGAVVRHNNHLHIQGFNFNTITDIIA